MGNNQNKDTTINVVVIIIALSLLLGVFQALEKEDANEAEDIEYNDIK